MQQRHWAYICAMKILMVCLGNICRSPLAEAIMREKAKQAGLNWMIDSAGTNGFHVGEPPHHLSQKVAALHGIDISTQRSRQFVSSDLLDFDRVYAMATDVLDEMTEITGKKFPDHKTSLFLSSLYPGEEKDVPDPWYGPEPGYHDVYELIERACDAIIEQHLIEQAQPEKN